ncbi:GEVED domain-containing protein, partial [Flavobacterium sp.]|uniref:GEVED domain-containing protein n=1 Tax=Flavobacterium sp. TaxID=239 RepID=UPI002636E0D1
MLLISGVNSYAQVSSYSFSQSTGTFTSITGGTQILTGNFDDGTTNFTLPFTFTYNGVGYTNIWVSANGHIVFGGASDPTGGVWNQSSVISQTFVTTGAVAAWAGDLSGWAGTLGGQTANVRAQVVGVSPNREAVIQWLARPAYSTSTTNAAFITFQIRLIETSNQVRIVYGASGQTVGSTNIGVTRQVGLRGATTADFNNRTNSSAVLFTASTAGTLNTSTQAFSSINATPGRPTSGLTYTWTPPSCSAPTLAAVSNLTLTSATINWNAASPTPSGGYQYEVRTSGAAGSGATGLVTSGTTSSLSVSLTGLTASTTYTYHVRSDCGSGTFSSWNSSSIFTGYCIPATTSQASWISAFSTTAGVSNITYSSPSAATGTGGYRNLTATNSASGFVGGSAIQLSMTAGGPTCGFAVWIDWNKNFAFETGERVYVTTGYVTTTTGSFSIPAGTALGAYRMRVFTDFNDFAPANACATAISRGEYVDFTFNVVAQPSCFSPTALTASSLTTNGATVSWTPPATGSTPVGYEYAVTTSTTPPTSGTFTTFASNAVTGLTANTTYYLHVRSVCTVGSDLSAWTTSTAFTTLCNAVSTFPWTETFETTSTTLSCFRVIDGNGDTDAWTVSTAAPRTGTRHASLYTDFNTSNNDYLITPQLTLDSAPKRLKFWVRAYSTTEVDEISVRVSTTGTALANFSNVVLASTPVTFTTYTEYTVDLSAFANQSIYIAFVRDAAPADGWYLYLDDVLVESTPPTITSFTPSAVCSANLTSTTVTVTGTLLNTVTNVKINGVNHAFTVVNPTTITIPLTSTTTSGLITVENAIATVNSATSLTVNTSPTVSAITGATNVLCKPNTLVLSNSTAGGVWTSSNINILTVSAGTVTGVAQGTANVIYTVTEANGCSTSVSYSVTVNEPVVITSNPGNQPVLTGNNTTFTVAATGTSLAYQWEESTDGGTSFASITNGGVYSGADTVTLTLTAVPDTMNGNVYRCVVSGAAPCSTETSLTAVLTVGNTGIDAQPSNVALCTSGDATFTVVPAGTVNSYQWYQDTGLGPEPLVDGGNVSGATTASLTLTGVDTTTNGYTYYVELVGPAITVNSNTVTLNVYTAASITSDPTVQTVCYSGGSVSYTAAAGGSFSGVQWQYSTNNSTWANVANGTPTGVTYNGATTTTLGVTTTAATPVAGTYYYRMMADATAPCTDVFSASAQLLINNPTVTTAPAAATVLAGNTATFTVASTATGTVTYQWQRATTLNGTYSNVVNATPANITYNGANTATLSVVTTSTTATGSGNFYRVIITSNGCAVTSTGASLTVNNYCQPTTTIGGATDSMTNVVITNVNQSTNVTQASTASSPWFTLYNNTPLNVTQGQNMSVSITFGSDGTQFSAVWVDYNRDGLFSDTENVALASASAGGGATVTYNFTVPFTSSTGITRIRVRGGSDSAYTAAGSCTSSSYGETEDYFINIIAAPSCAGTPAVPTAASSVSAACANSTINLSLSGISAELGYTYQWFRRSLPSGSFEPIAGATASTYAYVIPGSSEIYATITCTNSGLSSNSNTLTVTTSLCNYTVTRSTGITYNSIMSTGSTYTTLLGSGSTTPITNGDDGRTNVVSLAGTTFKYNGAAVTGFYATTNGWMTFNGAQTSAQWTNDLTSTGQNNVLAPFWEDLVIKGNLTASRDISMRYQIIGTLGSGTADIVIEWAEMERFLFPDPNINFQVVLHEADNSIDFNYGQMQLFNGATSGATAYTYSVGMNATNPSTADSTNRIMLQNNNNSNFSATTVQNSLDGSPDCNSRLRFVPSAALVSGSAPSTLIPANNDPAGAITLAVNNDPCISNCGNVYTSKNATATTGITACSATTPGTADDDVFFTFTTNSTITDYRIEMQTSPTYDLVVQVLNSSLTPIACFNASASGLSELIASITLSTSTQYYLRIYDAATGASGSGEFSICISQILPPPAYDQPAGAVSLTVGTSCTTVASVPAEILRSTATTGIQVCNATTAGTPDDDVWYKFTTPSVTTGVTYTINVQGNSTYNPVAQLFTGVPSTTNSLFCVNATNNGGLETITSSSLAPNTDYYLRVYHSGTGAANGSFSVCVFATLPTCVSAPTAPVNASNNCIDTTGTTLSWAAVTNATAYDVYFNGSLVSADQTTLSWVTPVLAAGNYTWSVVPKNPYGAATSCTNFTFTVNPESVGGTATPVVNAVCSGTGTTLTLNGNTGDIQWQSSANGTNGWTAITGATSATLSTGNLTATTYYRARSISGACANAFSNVVMISVDPVSVSGTAASAAGATPICSGTSTTLTLTGNTGTIQWESSANGSTGWSPIASATSASLSTGNLTSTTYYRAVVTSGVCSSATSNVITVTVYEVGTFYVDADGDTYGSVAATAQTICVPNASIAPAGYSVNNTDCNDAVSSTNPGAIDVCYDGIDNDCNGNVDNVGLPGGCIPIVSTIPVATCDAIILYNQTILT